MIKLYLRLHNAKRNFKKQFLNIGLLLFLILLIGTNANAQCDVNPVANQTVCNNTATTAINFTGTATTFNWVNNTTSIGLAASGTGNIPSFTALNATATAIIATITVTPSTGACTGTPISFTFTVNPSAVVSITPTNSCGGIAGIYGVPLIASAAGPPVPGSVTIGSGILNLIVPDNTANGVSNNIILTGVPVNATITNVTVTLNLSHTYPGDMIIHLKAPSGQILNLYKYNNGQFTGPVSGNATWGWYGAKVSQIGATAWSTIAVAPFIYNNSTAWKPDAINGFVAGSSIQNPTGFVSNATSFASLYTTGASTNGNWTLAMADGGMPGDIGILASWSMTIDYTVPAGPPHIFTWTQWPGLYIDPQTTNPYNGTNTPIVYAAPTAYTIYTVTGTNTATGCIGTATTHVNYTPPAPVVTPTPAIMCLGNPAIKLKVTAGLPARPATWSPLAGLFIDAASTIPYVGTPTDSLWARPTPAGTYTYAATTQSVTVPLCTPTTNFASTNGNATITFNVRNNHVFPIVLSQIDSRTLTAGAAIVSAYFKPSGIIGLPGAITTANGWVQLGAANVNGTGTGVQSLLTNLNLVIPASTTYGVCLQVLTASNAHNLSYSALGPGGYSFNDGGCELITGLFSGSNVPAAPTTALSGFVGAVHFSRAVTACTSPPRYVVVTVGSPISITAQPVSTSTCTDGAATFSVATAGSGPNTYQWQVSSNGGSAYTDLFNGGVYGGVTTATLTVTAPPVGISGYYYRVVINGTGACPATSAFAVLTVNPLPNIAITANPLIIGPTQTTTIFSAVAPNPPATYTWYYNNSVLPGEVSANLLVNYGYPGDYQLKVTDVNGCTNLSNILTIANSFALNIYTYPSPSAGSFQVRYYSQVNSTERRSLVVYDNRGERVMTRTFTQTIPYQKIDVDIRAHGKGLYWIELRDADGKRLAMNRAVVQ